MGQSIDGPRNGANQPTRWRTHILERSLPRQAGSRAIFGHVCRPGGHPSLVRTTWSRRTKTRRSTMKNIFNITLLASAVPANVSRCEQTPRSIPDRFHSVPLPDAAGSQARTQPVHNARAFCVRADSKLKSQVKSLAAKERIFGGFNETSIPSDGCI